MIANTNIMNTGSTKAVSIAVVPRRFDALRKRGIRGLFIGPTPSVKEGRGGLLGAIKKGKVLKKVEPPPAREIYAYGKTPGNAYKIKVVVKHSVQHPVIQSLMYVCTI